MTVFSFKTFKTDPELG